ncbi:MAG: UTP--glucose-1-phosphate uridylyltransferase GalU [Gammaproteobacteria bacterium]|nr:UTP--glucose-1-phosphate uridylyltransferase GalU [Gammaproteobacteria bacterium]MBI5615254.1 UTP--glucose-1-phosphate uridylyltransferase GalU [Gammaproteobacteria bacterium]
MTSAIRKAVFPVAGLGTRFLPATKANPKEMLPVVDKPLIQYAAEEAVAAGIEELIFVTGRNKRSIEDHFDKAYELEVELEKSKKSQMIDIVRNILPKGVSCIYIRQAEPLGLGHAVLCAKPAIGNEPFAILLADDLIDGGEKGCLKQMVDVFSHYNTGVIAVQPVPKEDTDKYGIVEVKQIDERVAKIQSIVEKPKPDVAPSNLGVVGRYILPGEIMGILEKTARGAGGEIQLTDGIATLLNRQQVLAYEFQGKRYDCGSKLGYLEATVEYALKHKELAADFAAYLEKHRTQAKA